jgi:hypothetical protein
MSLNESCGVDAFPTESCPVVVRASQVLYIIKTDLSVFRQR